MATRWDLPPKDALDTLFLRCPLWFPEMAQEAASRNFATDEEKEEWANSTKKRDKETDAERFFLLSTFYFSSSSSSSHLCSRPNPPASARCDGGLRVVAVCTFRP